ncbi:hypothetical protein JCM9279_007324 [Rhodotorula babjevae]
MSPDSRQHKRRRVHDDHLPAAVPPLAVHAAPPSPPSPPLSSVSALALFAAEMVAWLWFAPSPGAGGGGGGSPETMVVDRGQVRPTDRFVRFCQEVLATTQVSESVVILALLFISRLKQRNPINGAPGSEYRLAVTGLMLANKILDDNTYTAQTWSQVSSLELKPLVAGEAEFLRGLNWSLHVTGRDFEAWRKLLDGHVAARKARLGRLGGAGPGSLDKAARRSSSSVRARERGRARQGDLHGLGIGLEGDAPRASPSVLSLPPISVAPAVRYPLARPGYTASANTTPTSAFASYQLGVASAPPKAHPASSAPLPQYGLPAPSTEHRNPLEVSPTTIAFYRRNSGMRASAPSAVLGVKRSGDEAFAHEPPAQPYIAAALPQHIHAVQQVPDMVRSYSAGPAAPSAATPGAQQHQQQQPFAHFAPAPTPFYLHPAHHVTPISFSVSSSPHASRPSSSSSGISGHPPPAPFYFPEPQQTSPAGFSTLSDAFSPRYEPDTRRRLRQGTATLDYYSLAAGHGLGHLRQTLPPPTAAWPLVQPQYYYPVPGFAPVALAHQPPTLRTVPFSATTSPSAPPPFDSFAMQHQQQHYPQQQLQQQHPLSTPPHAYYGGALAAPLMSASTSQSAAMPPPRPHGHRHGSHRRTSSGGYSGRGAGSAPGNGGGGMSPLDLTSTPGGGAQAYSPTTVPSGLGAPYYSAQPVPHVPAHPHAHALAQHGFGWAQQPQGSVHAHQHQVQPQPQQGALAPMYAGYYSAYSNAGVPGVYYRG